MKTSRMTIIISAVACVCILGIQTAGADRSAPRERASRETSSREQSAGSSERSTQRSAPSQSTSQSRSASRSPAAPAPSRSTSTPSRTPAPSRSVSSRPSNSASSSRSTPLNRSTSRSSRQSPSGFSFRFYSNRSESDSRTSSTRSTQSTSPSSSSRRTYRYNRFENSPIRVYDRSGLRTISSGRSSSSSLSRDMQTDRSSETINRSIQNRTSSDTDRSIYDRSTTSENSTRSFGSRETKKYTVIGSGRTNRTSFFDRESDVYYKSPNDSVARAVQLDRDHPDGTQTDTSTDRTGRSIKSGYSSRTAPDRSTALANRVSAQTGTDRVASEQQNLSSRTLERNSLAERSQVERSQLASSADRSLTVNEPTAQNQDADDPTPQDQTDDPADPSISITGDNNTIVQGDVYKYFGYPYYSVSRPTLIYYDTLPHYYRTYTYDLDYIISEPSVLVDIRWTNCGSRVYYRYRSGGYYGVSYIYPKYHRKYVFVSLGGYWPVHYRYRRYYWYGCHPHYWYGSRPDTCRVIEKNTYNTYNYYGESYTGPEQTYTTNTYGDIIPDYDAIAQTRRRIQLRQDKLANLPNTAGPVDQYFRDGVQAFSEQDYDEAVLHFREGLRLDPEDMVLPFVYSQALMADGRYARAASVLRKAISMVPPEQKTVFYPRGLYEDENVLYNQLEELERAAMLEPFSYDLDLLLGYQWLGLGNLDKAGVYLQRALADTGNHEAVTFLTEVLELQEKIRIEQN